jgi:hypothetical protein
MKTFLASFATGQPFLVNGDDIYMLTKDAPVDQGFVNLRRETYGFRRYDSLSRLERLFFKDLDASHQEHVLYAFVKDFIAGFHDPMHDPSHYLAAVHAPTRLSICCEKPMLVLTNELVYRGELSDAVSYDAVHVGNDQYNLSVWRTLVDFDKEYHSVDEKCAPPRWWVGNPSENTQDMLAGWCKVGSEYYVYVNKSTYVYRSERLAKCFRMPACRLAVRLVVKNGFVDYDDSTNSGAIRVLAATPSCFSFMTQDIRASMTDLKDKEFVHPASTRTPGNPYPYLCITGANSDGSRFMFSHPSSPEESLPVIRSVLLSAFDRIENYSDSRERNVLYAYLDSPGEKFVGYEIREPARPFAPTHVPLEPLALPALSSVGLPLLTLPKLEWKNGWFQTNSRR